MGIRRDQSGVTFISVIFMVMIVGLMLAMTGQSWSRLMQREREEELLFRGMQIYRAISSWQRPQGTAPPQPLQDMKDLLRDPRSQQTVRHLRRAYLDPMTGKEFELLKGGGGIVGVASRSDAEPIKKAHFPGEFQLFEGKMRYSDWQFVPAKLRANIGQPVGKTSTGGGQPFSVIQGGTGQPVAK